MVRCPRAIPSHAKNRQKYTNRGIPGSTPSIIGSSWAVAARLSRFVMFTSFRKRIGAFWKRVWEAGSNNRVVLVVSQSSPVQLAVRIAAIQGRWRVIFARTIEDAWVIVRADSVRVVLYDSDMPWIEWRHAVSKLVGLSNAPVVILLSRSRDSRSWRSVLDYGGFDVVQVPVRLEEIRGVVDSAMALAESVESVSGHNTVLIR